MPAAKSKPKKPQNYKEGLYEIPWWHEWYEADCLKRQDMVQKLPIIRENILMLTDDKMPRKMREHAFTTMLNSYFEDLVDYMYVRQKKEHMNLIKSKTKTK